MSVSKNGDLQSTYTYDESDNRKSLALPDKTVTYDYDDANQLEHTYVDLTLDESFEFDDDGNMASRTKGSSTTEYTWDSFNKLTSIQGPEFSERYWYDHEGIRKLDGTGNKYYSSGAMSVGDRTAENSVSYIQGPQLLGMKMAGDYYWYISDGLGSVRAVVDSTGSTQVAKFSSDEFGQTLLATGDQALLQHTYTGSLGVRNELSGLLYMRQRYYDSSLGRWLSADPIGFKGGLNLYAYVDQNPTRFVDPSGERIYVRTAGGEKVYNDVSSFAGDLANYGPNSITNISWVGHGDQNSAGCDLNDDRVTEGLYYRNGHVYLEDRKAGKNYGTIGSLLAGRLKPGASFHFLGCSEASGKDNISRAASRELQDAIVSGFRSWTLGSWNKWGEILTFGLGHRTYQNGDFYNPPTRTLKVRYPQGAKGGYWPEMDVPDRPYTGGGIVDGGGEWGY